MRFTHLIILLLLLLFGESVYHYEVDPGVAFRGVNFVAPRDRFDEDPMPPLQQVGVNAVAVIPYGFSRLGEPRMQFVGAVDTGQYGQWWGERPEGVRETIALARRAGMQVMLKPQVWVPRSWPGDIDFETAAEWEAWEKDYRDYILLYAGIAAECQVDLFCVGTEFKRSGQKREAFWRSLIREVRSIYSGPLTYAANWDEYQALPFWDELDYIGIDAYFPLLESETPEVATLLEKWAPYRSEIRKKARQTGKPVLFTEYGYLSVDGCAGKTWLLEKDRRSLSANEPAQANAIEALYRTFWDEPYWRGGFLWKWYPRPPRRPGWREKDYTPQGKLAEEVMRRWFR